MAWKPGQRGARRALEDPYEDVPLHLRQPLWNWISSGFQSIYGEIDEERIQQVAIDLRIHMPSTLPQQQLKVFLDACNGDEAFMLDLVEAILERYGWDNRRALTLQNLLTSANSAYRVKESWDALEERVTPGVKELVQEVIDASGGSAGDHLTNAWNEAYGRKPDPVKAYSEAIKAVEAALAQRVSPQNGKQTLGTMIRDISAKPSKWKFIIGEGAIDGVDTMLHMMRTLWAGQTSRHGSSTPTRAETPEESRAAVHLAATLVQFGNSGAFDGV
jgi:hypothetical protein